MKIKCRSRGLLVNFDNTLWPCCWTCTQKPASTYLKNLPKDWNSLDKHTAEEILKHEAFTKHFNDEHWNDLGKADEICRMECGIDE